MKRMITNHLSGVLLAWAMALGMPLKAVADDVTVADANGNQLTYSYDSADGPATFKGVKTYATDEAKRGRIVIADAVSDANGRSHEVKYVGGSVSNRSSIVSIVFGRNIVATGGPDGLSASAFAGCSRLVSVTLNTKLQILGTETFMNCYALENINLGDCNSLTAIMVSALEDCDHVRQLTVPASVTTIGKWGIYSIDSLRSLTFATGSQLQTIGDNAFQYNYVMESINLEACTKLTSIGSYALYSCPSLRTITIPAAVETFGSNILGYTDNIETMTFLAASVPNDFYRDRKKLTTLNIGAGVKRIGTYAFRNNLTLKQLNISNDVNGLEIAEGGFSECDSLATITLPAGVATLGNYAFYSIDHLKSFTFAAGSRVTEIPYQCFYNCRNLEQLTIPDAVTTVGAAAFYLCRALRELTFGTGLTTLTTSSMFGYCDKLEKITLPGVNYPFTSELWMPDNVVLYVHPDLVEVYRTTDYTKNYRIMAIGATTDYAVTTTAGGQLQSKVPEDQAQYALKLTVTGPLNGTDIDYLHAQFPLIEELNLRNARIVSGGDAYHQWNVSQNGTATIETYYGPWPTENNVVGYAMFYNMPTLRRLTLPSGTTKIGEYALAQDRIPTQRLEYVDIPSTVNEIGHHAFHYAGILQATVPSGVQRIEDYTFWHCEKLTTVSLPNSISYIGNSAFSEDYELQDVNTPSQLQTIGDYAFYNNYKRRTPATFPASLRSIGYRAFFNNYVLPSVTFNNGLESVGQDAFQNCYTIEQAALPQSLTSLGNGAFYHCDSLRQFTFPQNIKQVPNDILGQCVSLERVTLAEGTTRIGYAAFNGCKKLSQVNLEGQNQLTYIDTYAFYGTALPQVTLPNSITDMGYSTFRANPTLQRINVPTGMDYVPYDFVVDCPNLKQVVMHNGIRRVGHNAFINCTSLASIDLNDQITDIEYDAFSGCSALQIEKLPAALTHIGGRAFQGTTAMRGTFTVPATVTAVDDNAFAGSGLDGIVFAGAATTIGAGALRETPNLSTVMLPAQIETIHHYTFYKATALKQIDLPETVTRIEYNAFDLSGLESIELPENLNHIGSYAFASTQLRSFRLPDGFATADFGSYALAYNYRLKTAYMGRNLDYSAFSDFTAFYRCDSLELLRLYAGTPPSANAYYFGFRQNCVLEVPEDAIALYQQANVWKDFKEIRGFYTGDELREQDFAVMQALYEKLDGGSWTQPWNMENNRHTAGKWAGVTTAQVGNTTTYVITSIDLSDRGLTGELPADLFRLKDLTTLNLSHNHISGNLATVLSGFPTEVRAPISTLNLQGNALTGDLCELTKRMPNLTSLNVSYNRLTDISQAIDKTKLGTLNLEMQFVDWHTNLIAQDVDERLVQNVTVGEPFALNAPSLFTYRHSDQDFGHKATSLARVFHTTYWTYDWEFGTYDGQLNLGTNSDNCLRAQKNQIVAYSDLESGWRTVLLRLNWQDGDVNADQTVDVTDLQSVIYYALNDRKASGQMFNHTAADANGDDRINVADVVGTVDYILGYAAPASSRARIINKVSPDTQNLITADGTLLNADAVAALQLTVTGATVGQLQASDELRSRFSVSMRPADDGVRIVVYSASGSTLQPGEYQLLSRMPAGAAITAAVLSDSEARHLGVTIDGATTTLPFVATESQNAVQEVFDLSGRRLDTNWEQLPQGIYVVRVNGKQYKVKK